MTFDWQRKRQDAREKVLEWVSKYDTGNDPECLKFMLEAYKEHCQVEEAYEIYLAKKTEPLNDWRHAPTVGQYFRHRGEYHCVAMVLGTVLDTEGKSHPISECEFGFWTQEEIDKATVEAAITRKWLVEDVD